MRASLRNHKSSAGNAMLRRSAGFPSVMPAVATVAQTLVGLSVDLANIMTHSTLQSGIVYATREQSGAGVRSQKARCRRRETGRRRQQTACS